MKPSHRSSSSTRCGSRSLGRRRRPAARPASAKPCCGEQLLPAGDLVAQAVEQPVGPVGLVAGRRPRRSAAARPAAAARRCRSRCRRGARRRQLVARAMRRRSCAARCDRPDRGAPTTQQVAERARRSSASGAGPGSAGRSSIAERDADRPAVRRSGCGSARQLVQRDLLAQRRQPGAAAARDAERVVAARIASTSTGRSVIYVGRPRRAAGARWSGAPSRSQSSRPRAEADGGAAAAPRPAAADPAGLERR